jgi:hypothetical protein
MKTAMQEAIKEIAELWSSPSDRPNYTQIFKVLESKLEKEKEQFDDMFDEGFESAYQHFVNGKGFVKFEDYYNQTYNQNK